MRADKLVIKDSPLKKTTKSLVVHASISSFMLLNLIIFDKPGSGMLN